MKYKFKRNVTVLQKIGNESNSIVVDLPEILIQDCKNEFPCLIIINDGNNIYNEIMKLKKMDGNTLEVDRFNTSHFNCGAKLQIFLTKEEINNFTNLLNKNAN